MAVFLVSPLRLGIDKIVTLLFWPCKNCHPVILAIKEFSPCYFGHVRIVTLWFWPCKNCHPVILAMKELSPCDFGHDNMKLSPPFFDGPLGQSYFSQKRKGTTKSMRSQARRGQRCCTRRARDPLFLANMKLSPPFFGQHEIVTPFFGQQEIVTAFFRPTWNCHPLFLTGL
jgi:hypothetical protein